MIATFAAVACGFPLLTLRRFQSVVIANLLVLAVSAGLTLALAPSNGAKGAAFAALIAEIGLAVSQGVLLKRALPGVSLPFLSIVAAGLAAGIAALIGVLLPVHPLIGVLVASAFYFGLLKLLGIFPPEVGEILRGLRGGAVRSNAGG